MKRPNKWFSFADEDWLVAKQTLKDGIYNQVCFHSQQGVEKLLKGVLHQGGQKIPKTHHLQELLGMCIKHLPSLKDFEEDCLLLDRYYIPTRYPDALPGALPEGLPNKEDAEQALRILENMRQCIEKK